MRSGKYSAELINTVCERLAGGEPLAVICREDGMPSVTTMWVWSREIPGVAESIARAREIGEHVIGDDCLAIADDRTDDPASRRVRVETRLKLLAKWNPKKWGDRVQHADADGGKLPPATIVIAPVATSGSDT